MGEIPAFDTTEGASEMSATYEELETRVQWIEAQHESLKAKVREYQDLRDQLDDWRSWKGEEIKRQAILQAADEKFEEIRELVK